MTRNESETVSLPLAELVEDMALYPRHAVDDAHVQSLAMALEAGAQLPPVVADKKSKRITDGWHRCRAYKRVQGADAVVDVELVPYKNEAEMILDAVRRNSAHGRKLDRIDQTRSVVMMENHGLTVVQIALALNVPEERIEKLRVKVATTRSASPENVPGTRTITLKRPVRHLEGTTLSKEQVEVHGMLPGTSFLMIARQLTRALQTKMVDLTDKKLVDGLKQLREALAEAV